MDHLDVLYDLKGQIPLERVTTACAMALNEYSQCIAHDEPVPVPPGLSEELHRRLNHGRDLAMDRAQKIRDALETAISHLPIRALPPEYQRFHSGYHHTIGAEELKKFADDWENDRDLGL